MSRLMAFSLRVLACSVVLSSPPVPSWGERRPLGRHSFGLALRRAIKLVDCHHADLGDRLLRWVGLLAAGLGRILVNANAAFDLNVRALGERSRELRELSPD